MIGETIDNRYKIEAIIGRGGMGAVYKAAEVPDNDPVALKFLHAYMDMGAQTALTRFQREFRVLAQLNHPNIVRAYQHGSYQKIPYLVLEYLSGHTLSKEVGNGPLSRARLLQIARQICEALIYIHSQGIVHRDLKPGNIMLLDQEDTIQVKLMDFGLVRLNNLSQQLTQEGAALGTVAYMAPEQAQALPIDFRADLYALGVILYEMATGRVPFEHQNPAMVLMQQMTSNPPSPRQINPNIDNGLEQLILHLLAKEPAERPTTTNAVRTQLAQLADESVVIMPQTPRRADTIPRIPFIGQAKLLHALTAHWNQTKAGHGQVVLLAGVAGSGKTRLLTEASLTVRLDNGKFKHTTCREQAAIPYQPFVDMLSDIPADYKNQLPDALRRLLPEYRYSTDNQTTSRPSDEAQWQLFSAIRELFTHITHTKPIMFVVEDLQWADQSTVDLVNYLAQHVATMRMMLVLTYRSEELDDNTALKRIQRSLRRNPWVHRLTVSLLNRDQVTDFLWFALGQRPVSDWMVDNFYQATEGNPFFIEETLKAIAAEGKLHAWQDSTSSQIRFSTMMLQLPKNVLALAERRLELLSTEDRTTLTAAAVIGPEFCFNELERVTNLSEDDLLDSIDRLLSTQLIYELPLTDEEDRYHFAQEALRQALLNTISRRRRRQLHKRAGEAVLSLWDTKQARFWPILAHHFLEAGDKERTLKYSRLAGDAAYKIHATIEAIAQYTQALAIMKMQWEETQAIDLVGPLRYLYLRLGRSYELTSQFGEALCIYKEMEELSHDCGARPLELESLIARAVIFATPTNITDFKEGERLAHTALNLAQELGDQPAEAKALWALQLVHVHTDRPRKAIAYAEQSLAIARKLELTEQIAYTLNDSQIAYRSIGELDKGRAALKEAQTLWRLLGNIPMLSDNMSSEVLYTYLDGDYNKVVILSEEIWQLIEPTGNIWGQTYAQWVVGIVYYEWGEINQAVEMIKQTIQLGQQGGFLAPQIMMQAILAMLYGQMGDLDRAMTLIQETIRLSDDTNTMLQADALAVLTRLQIMQADFTSAEATLTQAKQDLSTEEPASFATIWLSLAEIELALVQQAYEHLFELYKRFTERFDRVQAQPFRTDLLHLYGLALWQTEQSEQAREVLNEAKQIAETLTSRRSLWPILLTLSQIETELGNASKADALCQEAQTHIQFIADHTPLDLRDTFLALPQVRQVMG